jgi:hypothetical protein
MKQLTLALFFVFVCAAAVRSQDTLSVNPPMDQERVEIEIRDLPEVIRTSLQGQEYVGWTIMKAYKGHMNDPEDPLAPSLEIYIVDLKNGDQTTTAIFDKDGNRLDEIKPDGQE